jgi:hypothetical protein
MQSCIAWSVDSHAAAPGLLHATHVQRQDMPAPTLHLHLPLLPCVLRYSDPQDCHKAVAALHGRLLLGSGTAVVELECSLALHVEARTLRAVRPQLALALAKARATVPDVTVTVLERSAQGAAGGAAGRAAGVSMLAAGLPPPPQPPPPQPPQPPPPAKASCTVPAAAAAAAAAEPAAQAAAAAEAAPVVLAHGGSSRHEGTPAAATEALVRISGKQQERVIRVRRELEAAVAGRVYQGRSPADMAVLMAPQGKAFLMGLEAAHTDMLVSGGRHLYSLSCTDMLPSTGGMAGGSGGWVGGEGAPQRTVRGD